jgi:hypothetical protein
LQLSDQALKRDTVKSTLIFFSRVLGRSMRVGFKSYEGCLHSPMVPFEIYLAPSVLPMIISMLLYVGVSYGVVFNSSGTRTNHLARGGGYESLGLLSINEIPNLYRGNSSVEVQTRRNRF